MTHEHCIERLSDRLDGTLAGAEARAVEEHLAGCAACARVEAELRALVDRAHRLPDRAPARDLWPGIAAALGTRAGAPRAAAPGSGAASWSRRVSLPVPHLAAAGLALALASGAAAWWARPLAAPPEPVASTPPPAVGAAAAAPLPQERGWAEEVARLEAAVAAADGLDAATVRVLERNLEIIDRAIRESREALAADPGNTFLEEHLARSWARKVSTLREAADLAAWPRS